MTLPITFLRPGRPADAPTIASLIMEAMSADCCAHFYGPQHTAEEFQQFMTSLCMREHTQYSYQNTIIAECQGEIAGITVSYDGALLSTLRQPFWNGMMQQFNRDLTNMDDETQAGELYLDSFAVFPQFRQQGIGLSLLHATIHKAEQLGLPCVGLLVDVDNPNAERLYQKAGFSFCNDSSWGGHNMKHLQCPVAKQTSIR